jgi:hypothetical protein
MLAFVLSIKDGSRFGTIYFYLIDYVCLKYKQNC